MNNVHVVFRCNALLDFNSEPSSTETGYVKICTMPNSLAYPAITLHYLIRFPEDELLTFFIYTNTHTYINTNTYT